MKFLCFNKYMKPDKETFDMFYTLLDRVLPRDEHRDSVRQYELFKNDFYNLIYVYDKDKYTGSLAYWDLGELCFVEHLCVMPDCQSKGYGSALLEHLISLSDVPVVLEVEPPGTDTSDRRIKFYERCGFRISLMEYFQLPLNDGDAPLRLNIMYTPCSEQKLCEYISLIQKIVYIKK